MTEASMTFNQVPGGKRVLAGWLLAPFAAIAFWKSAAILIVPATYLVMLLLGVPALRYCYRRQWLQWWHALAAGWLASIPVAVLYLLSVDTYHAEIAGPGSFVMLQSYGAAVGLLFWGVAILGNPSFPQRATNWPLLVLCTGVLGFLSWTCLSRLEVHEVFGKVIGTPSSRQVTLALPDGTSVQARFSGEAPKASERREVGAYTRFAALSDQRLYWMNGVCKEADGRIVPCQFDESFRAPPPRSP